MMKDLIFIQEELKFFEELFSKALQGRIIRRIKAEGLNRLNQGARKIPGQKEFLVGLDPLNR